jgi:hypothetical protein
VFTPNQKPQNLNLQKTTKKVIMDKEDKFGYVAEKIDGGYIIHVDDGTTGFLTAVEFEQFKKNRGENLLSRIQ